MAEINLKKLNRRELLELLLQARQENERLQQEIEQLRAENGEQTLQVEEIGSIAEASLKLSGVFEAAQRAADLYLENVRLTCQEQSDTAERLRQEIGELETVLETKRRECDEMVAETQRYCENLVRQAQDKSARRWIDARTKMLQQVKEDGTESTDLTDPEKYTEL